MKLGFTGLLAIALIAGAAAPPAAAQATSQPMRMVVGVAPGGSLDQMARIIATKLKDELGRPVVMEYRAGANMLIASKFVSGAEPNGSTLLAATGSILLNALGKDAVDPLRDLTPIDLFNTVPLVVVVNPKLPVNTMKELVDHVRANPGRLNGASGVTFMHVAGAILMKMADMNFAQIPYNGVAPALNAVVGGEANLAVMDVATAAPFVRSGRVKGLMVSSPVRSKLLPDVPTSAEAGYPDFKLEAWGAIWAPKNTPAPVVATLHSALVKVMADKEVQDLIAAKGAESAISTPAKFAERIASESAIFKKAMDEQGIAVK